MSFYRFPANEEQRQKWTAAVKRDGWQPTSATRLCSAHFAKGKRDSNPLSPDFVPSIFNHTPSQMRLQKIREMETFERRRKMRRGMREVASSMGGPASTAEEFNTSIISEQGLQRIQECRDLQEQEQQLKEELEVMDQKLMVSSLTSISLDDRKTRLCTGLPSLAVFTWLIDLLSGHLASFDCISKPDQLLITLMKLRLSLSTQDLASRFNTSTQAIENILSDAIPIMACKLDFLICWPVRTHPRNIPRPFKPNFKNCSVIIDCLEFPTEKPLNITAESQTWSDIKHQTTIKCLVGITPYGSFSYVSQCWGGRITDRELVLVSGVLEHVYRGDMVITCKDFSIQQELSEKRAKLIVLESLDSPEKIISDHELATVSLFIEKAFKRIKRYKILSQTLPIPLLPYIDEVVTCCLAFSNLQPKFQ